jgi:AhpD family alkylhydroperoxidase
MTVFPYPELDAGKETQYELFPINLTRMMLHTKGQTVPYLNYSLSFRDAAIEPLVRERVIVRVGVVADCAYELVQHTAEALRTGTSQQVLAELLDPRNQIFDDPSLTALVKYVDSLVENIGASELSLDDLRSTSPTTK